MKGNIFLGMGRGSVGDVTFFRFEGQQAARARNRQPANPRTDSQMVIRTFLKTASMAYATLRNNLGDQTFQGAKVGAQNQRRFIARNIRLLQNAVNTGTQRDYNFARRDQGQAPLNRYVISEGSLPDPALIITEVSEGTAVLTLTNSLGLSTTSTYSDVCAALGLPAGSQLTFVLIYGQRNSGVMENVVLQRIILAASNGDMNTAFLDNGLPNMPNPANITDHLRGIAFGDAGEMVVSAVAQQNMVGAACVASQQQGATWLYSTSQIYQNAAGVLDLDSAIASWAQDSGSQPIEYTRQAESTNILPTSGVTSLAMNAIKGAEVVGITTANGNEGTLEVESWGAVGEVPAGAIILRGNFYGAGLNNLTDFNMWVDFGSMDYEHAEIECGYDNLTRSFMYEINIDEGYPTSAENIVVHLRDDNGAELGSATYSVPPFPQG